MTLIPLDRYNRRSLPVREIVITIAYKIRMTILAEDGALSGK